jgi:hypothetical protein
MSTDLQQDLREFHGFIGRLLENGGATMTLEDSVAEFRAYQEELHRCREAIRPALEASLRGESTPLDMGEIIQRVTSRLRSEGIPD